ncbi:putative cytochrome C-type heme-binding periplasmic protein [Campylobacter hyointestinalis subsp. hyointestinalis]|uniref:Cytochrome C-type heme-binding periplasmic protein n=1 Tax=Campylobacter hyointestinalis subsp. hyointestinalis TaxID=91352 RepID=A0A9W5EVW6_CAMHY|nr:hypothetical protein [Campylobacter hyointestinalis]CUU70642.1 putative cytochrome C-type heme-binding periplasmic protein [Campylobacter hyointestinalis subsp. hyointestinalis]CUU70643.1 putative cytochrome C-type heme-binding periplasmic protein [Campylobacter hyointestinalis subsp. hyointestinalis]CUU85652.1 putative cytochrome C-type heme-binding periplasmic protein [Campylobacter hyointestinalis subsp. hyointestinalis]
MKKIIFTSLLLGSCVFGEVYSTAVKPVYLDKTSNIVAGKLLPTNGIEILEEKDGFVKFSIKGYQNPAVPNIVYYSNNQRILSLAFAKTKTPKFKIIKEGKNGQWNEVKVNAYTTSGEFENGLEPMMKKASELYTTNCSICHALHKVEQYNANQWPSLFKSMLSRTPIDKKDEWLVIQYLQKNAKDSTKDTK